jgi:ribosomal protein S18 acetylase RimI-like enzyme
MIIVTLITIDDDLLQLVDEINQASWDNTNDMSVFDVDALTAYINHQDTLFVACHDITEVGRTFMGMDSARLEIKPYHGARWLYVDEVDVCSDQRQKGAGKAIMRKLIEFANEAGCEEVWLAAESDNHAANALYRSLEPGEVAQIVGYTYNAQA